MEEEDAGSILNPTLNHNTTGHHHSPPQQRFQFPDPPGRSAIMNMKTGEEREGVGALTSPPGGGGGKDNEPSSSSTSRPSSASTGGGGGGVNSPPPAKKTPNDFIFGKLLGEGSFSSVYLAKDVKTGKEFAIKVCDKQHIIREKKAESIKTEKEVLTILSGNSSPTIPFFVHLYATFQDSQRLYFVVTFGHGGELLKCLQKVGSFDLACCRFYSAEILQALRHLHTLGIVHRDLKPENILLNENGHILITDYGSAKILRKSSTENSSQSATTPTESREPANNGRTRKGSFVGTAQYVSPEVLQGRYSEVGPPADLWAFGCVLFQLVAGILPFQAPNEYIIFQKILKLEYQFPSGFLPAAKDLVERLLKLEPNDRLGAKDEELYQSIQSHSFFEGVEFDKLCDQVPPVISGTGTPSASSLRSQRHAIPESYGPGFDPRVIAERALKSEQDDWYNGEEDSDKSGGSGDAEDPSLLCDGIGRLTVAGDNNNPSPPTESISSSRSIQLPRDEGDRKRRLEEQLQKHPASHSAVKGNLILKQGLVNKRKGLFARKRLFFLTEGPHIYYCEPNTLNVKGEIPWSKELKPEAKDFKFFLVHTPNRTYYLEDPEGYALEWCRAINEIHQHIYGNPSASTTPTSPNQ